LAILDKGLVVFLVKPKTTPVYLHTIIAKL